MQGVHIKSTFAAKVHGCRCCSSCRTRSPVVRASPVAQLLLGWLVDQGLVNVRDDTTTGDGGFDECVEFLVSSDGQLQVSRGDAFHLEILGGIPCQFEHFGGEVLCSFGSRRGPSPSSVLHHARGVSTGAFTYPRWRRSRRLRWLPRVHRRRNGSAWQDALGVSSPGTTFASAFPPSFHPTSPLSLRFRACTPLRRLTLSMRWMRPTGNCSPARTERDTAFFLSPLAFPPMVPLAPFPASPFAPLPDIVDVAKRWDAHVHVLEREELNRETQERRIHGPRIGAQDTRGGGG